MNKHGQMEGKMGERMSVKDRQKDSLNRKRKG